jgi:hypothetical protein
MECRDSERPNKIKALALPIESAITKLQMAQ